MVIGLLVRMSQSWHVTHTTTSGVIRTGGQSVGHGASGWKVSTIDHEASHAGRSRGRAGEVEVEMMVTVTEEGGHKLRGQSEGADEKHSVWAADHKV